jgi:hypothetical protein
MWLDRDEENAEELGEFQEFLESSFETKISPISCPVLSGVNLCFCICLLQRIDEGFS